MQQPVSWFVAGLLLLLPALQSGLGPFPEAGISAASSVAARWAFPAALCGVGTALLFLSHASDVLSWVAPRSRIAGEWGTLLLAALLPQFLLGIGAWLDAPGTWRVLTGQLPAVLLLGVHLAAIACILLRLPAGSSLRLLVFASLWFTPILVGDSPLAVLLCPGGRPPDAASWLGTGSLLALSISLGLPPRPSAP